MFLLNRLAIAAAVAITAIGANAQRIAVLSDIHVTPGNECEKQLRAAVAEINAANYDAVVLNGDLSNEGSDEQLACVKAIVDGIRHPFFIIPGNHENNWSQSATKTFVDLWGNDRFVAHLDSLIIVGMNCGPFMKMGDGHIKQEDLHWLESTLAEHVTPGTRVLSFNHYPLADDLDNAPEYIAILERYPVIGHVNGHYHTSRVYRGGDIDAVMVRALDMKHGNYGYTIIEVEPDWVHVYDKTIGQAPRPVWAWATRTEHTSTAVPAARTWEQPEGFEVTRVWADSASVFTRLGFDADRIYFGNSLGIAKAIDRATGELAWEIPTGAALFSRPVALQRGRVAIPTCDAILVVDGRTGRTVKRHESIQGPYVADGLVAGDAYLQGGYKRFERRRPSDGRLVWSYDSIFNYCQAAPAVDGRDLIFGAWDTNLRCLDLATGRLRWVWNNGKSANMLGPGNVVPVITAERVYVVAPDRYMTAIDRATGQTIWRNNDHKYRESLGRSTDGTRVYAKTMDGELVAIDTTTPDFHELWTIDMGLGYEHAPCIVAEADGVVYAGSRRGVITAVDPVEARVLWSIPVGVSEVNGIDIDPITGDVYASLIEGTIVKVSRR